MGIAKLHKRPPGLKANCRHDLAGSQIRSIFLFWAGGEQIMTYDEDLKYSWKSYAIDSNIAKAISEILLLKKRFHESSVQFADVLKTKLDW